MGNTWVTDIRHFPGSVVGEPIPPDMHAAAFRMGEFMGRMVAAATSTFWPGARETGLRCRRKPGRRPCPGHLVVQRDDEREYVHWQCSACDDNGLIHGWRGCIWDLSSPDRSQVAPEKLVTVHLDDDGYAVLLSAIQSMEREAERAVMAAAITKDRIRIAVPEDEVDELTSGLALEANSETNRRRQRSLIDLLETFERASHR